MLGDKIYLTYVPIAHKQRFGQTDTGIEVEVGHRHRVLEDVPETLLRVEQEQICAQRQRTLGESLGYGYLKLDVGIVGADMLPHRTSEDEIIVLVQTEIGARVECLTDTVGVDRLIGV